MEPEHAAKIIRQYATERVMFGTDYPMWNAKEELERIAAVPLTDRERELIMGKNALALLTICDSLVTGEALPAEDRQNTFTKMMEIALTIA